MDTHTDAYHKEYRIKEAVKGKKSLVVTFPYEVVDREARKRNLTIHEFLERFIAVAQYNSFDGVHYTFKEI